MIKGVVFDLDGVYFKSGMKQFAHQIVEKFKIDKPLVEEVLFTSEEMKKYKQGLLQDDDFWNFAMKKWNISTTTQDLLTLLKDSYERDDAVQELVFKVKKLNIKTIVCTNNFPGRIRVLNEEFDFLKDFDYVILSFKHRMLKPELFTKLPSITGLKTEEIVIIDDNESSLEQAKKNGFKTILCEESISLRAALYDLNISC